MQHVYEVCNALFNALTNVANALRNIANAFKNNYSTLQSIYNGLKYVATHFFNAFFNVFSMHFRLISYAGFLQIGSQIVHLLFKEYRSRSISNSEVFTLNNDFQSYIEPYMRTLNTCLIFSFLWTQQLSQKCFSPILRQ